MKQTITILKLQLQNYRLILMLSFYSIKNEYSNHYLGIFWNVIQPIIQLIIYYVVFGLGLRSGGDKLIDGIPFIIHLLTGLFPWLFISQSINSGAVAINKNIGILSKMRFPSSIFISVSITNNIVNLFITTTLVFIISITNNFVSWWHYLYFIYFLFSSITLLYGISLITSSLVIIVKDTKNVLQNMIRMFFFITPIFWSIQESNSLLQKIAILNPFGYLVEIYRLSFVSSELPILNLSSHIYFWSISIFIMLVGSLIHNNFENKLLDYT
ncbi:ABC transporter permease [Mammaliicoccus sciuri]|uniref:ABC transporter permease n=1 Tax=Mammaliicoccus sciuri TaxID=1296 RepID=UPI003F57432B